MELPLEIPLEMLLKGLRPLKIFSMRGDNVGIVAAMMMVLASMLQKKC